MRHCKYFELHWECPHIKLCLILYLLEIFLGIHYSPDSLTKNVYFHFHFSFICLWSHFGCWSRLGSYLFTGSLPSCRLTITPAFHLTEFSIAMQLKLKRKGVAATLWPDSNSVKRHNAYYFLWWSEIQPKYLAIDPSAWFPRFHIIWFRIYKAAGYDPTLFCLCNKHTLKIVPSKSPHHWDARIWLICKWDTFQTAQNWHPSQLVWDASNLWLLYPNQIQTEPSIVQFYPLLYHKSSTLEKLPNIYTPRQGTIETPKSVKSSSGKLQRSGEWKPVFLFLTSCPGITICRLVEFVKYWIRSQSK